MPDGIAKLILLSLVCAFSMAEPIKPHPANRHYFIFQGEPAILITSAEHYGAVINKAFDYVPYLDTLKTHGLNYRRFYPGAMFETNQADWVDPASGSVVSSERITSEGGNRRVSTPTSTVDVALRIKRMN
jgi:hypothetical protein